MNTPEGQKLAELLMQYGCALKMHDAEHVAGKILELLQLDTLTQEIAMLKESRAVAVECEQTNRNEANRLRGRVKELEKQVDILTGANDAASGLIAKLQKERDTSLRDSLEAHGNAELEVAKLQSRCEQLEKERDSLLIREDALARELVGHREKARGNYWAWQGDGDDHLESLVTHCPVLIQAKDLQAIIKEREQLEARWKAAEEVLQGRCDNIVTNPVHYACEQYIAAEDSLPDCFDTEDYCLSRAVESLVRQSEQCEQLESKCKGMISVRELDRTKQLLSDLATHIESYGRDEIATWCDAEKCRLEALQKGAAK